MRPSEVVSWELVCVAAAQKDISTQVSIVHHLQFVFTFMPSGIRNHLYICLYKMYNHP